MISLILVTLPCHRTGAHGTIGGDEITLAPGLEPAPSETATIHKTTKPSSLKDFLNKRQTEIIIRNDNWREFVELLNSPEFRAELLAFATKSPQPSGDLGTYLKAPDENVFLPESMFEVFNILVNGKEKLANAFCGDIAKSLLAIMDKPAEHLKNQESVQCFTRMFSRLREVVV